jgi:hypothetical protein
MTPGRYYMTVRAPRGKRRHVVRAVGDYGVGATICGLRSRGWTIEPDAEPDCARCQALVLGNQ